jgi:hypothetical protein
LPELERANSFYCPTGRWSCRGWVLLDRDSYNQINPYLTDFQLSLGDPTQPNNVGVLRNLSIVQAQCVTRGLPSDLDALYLVELTDDEGVLFNQWFQMPLTTAYNIRAPAYPQGLYPWSTNGGTGVGGSGGWTWSSMLQDIWTRISTVQLLGNWPGLPFTPTGTPEGFWFSGVPAWPAFVDVLEYLGMTLVVDPTVPNNPYGIVQTGAADPKFATLQAKYAGNLEDDLEWIDAGSGRVPGSVTVAFRRRNSIYGTEETVRLDNVLQWESAAYYTVTVAAPAQFSSATGTHLMWSDFTVRYDQDGVPLSADVAAADTIAAERVAQYYSKIYRGTSGFLTQTYAGALPFKTGSLVDGVKWWMDPDDGGWRTQIIRGAFSNDAPWPDLWDSDGIAL